MSRNLHLKINNKEVTFFNDFNVNLKYNSVGSTFGFNYFFDPDNPEHKSIAKPSQFRDIEVFEGEQKLLTGTILNNDFKTSSTKVMTSFGGYSKPGVLDDCNIPPESYPLQFDGLSLEEIAQKLIKPFGLQMIVDSAVQSRMSKEFDTTTASSSETIKDYLADLASQKNIILSHNADGNLLFTEVKTKQTPILDFDLTKQTPSGMTFDFNYNGQSMHSQITVMKQASLDGGNAGEETIKNPYVPAGVFRPKVIKQSSGDDNDTILVAKRALSNELRGLPLVITTNSLFVDGVLMLPNNTISIKAPNLYIYERTEFFIESINYLSNTKSKVATITCVLPEVYNNETPNNIYG